MKSVNFSRTITNSVEMIRRYFEILQDSIALDKTYFSLQIISAFFEVGMTLVTLLLPKYLLTMIRIESWKGIILVLAVSAGATIANAMYGYFTTPIIESRKERLSGLIIDRFLKKSIVLRLQYFDETGAYDSYALAFGQCNQIVQNVINNFVMLVSALLQIAVIIALLSWMSPLALLLLIFTSGLQTYLNNLIKRKRYEYKKLINHHGRKLNYIYRLFHIPEFMRDVRVNSISDFIFKKRQEVVDEVIHNTAVSSKAIAARTGIQSIISAAESFCITGYFTWLVIRKVIWYDNFVMSLNSYSQLKNAISRLLSVYNAIYENDLYVQDYQNFMNSDDVTDSGNLRLDGSQIISIEFRDVRFCYPNTEKPALDGVSFSISRGEKIAIIGSNGAGKTTIIKLLLRLYDPDSGEILINGLNIKEYNPVSLREAVTVLFQDYSMYAFSVRDNLSLGHDTSDDEIEYALRRVEMWDKIQRLPMGLDTPITSQLFESGVEFSGGERQRLAIARMYIRQKGFLVLDEPTSNLDPFVESRLYEDLFNKTKSTMLIISHRITFAYRMSKIICMENGIIKEMGTHQDLIAIKDGIYREMYDLNTVKYVYQAT